MQILSNNLSLIFLSLFFVLFLCCSEKTVSPELKTTGFNTLSNPISINNVIINYEGFSFNQL